MSSPAIPIIDLRHDGFGSRRVEHDGALGRLELLDLSSALSTSAAEQGIRTRAARLAEANATMVARVVGITRRGQTLSIRTASGEGGVTLSDLLAALEFGTVTLSDQALLELAGATVRAVAALHQLPGLPAHGALNPAHVIVRRDGSVLLSGAVFADALQALQCNREQIWRVFGVAMPPSATLPRFDQRADVTQLGALVLAIILRRSLTATEYPKGIIDLVAAGAEGIRIGTASRTALTMWLQQALQLHPKSLFASAVDASGALTAAVADVTGRRAGALLLQAVVRQLCGDPSSDDVERTAPVRVVAPPLPVAEPPRVVTPAPRGLGLLRNVFPALRAN